MRNHHRASRRRPHYARNRDNHKIAEYDPTNVFQNEGVWEIAEMVWDSRLLSYDVPDETVRETIKNYSEVFLGEVADTHFVDSVMNILKENLKHSSHRANRKRANLMSLDEALQQVANASFYEDLVVIPVDGGFVVEDGYSYLAEGWEYTEMGLDGPDHFETTRLMESYESFDSPHHIRYNMPESVEALENGQAVEFAYAVVMDLDIDWGDDELNEMYEGGEVAGWLLVSQIQ